MNDTITHTKHISKSSFSKLELAVEEHYCRHLQTRQQAELLQTGKEWVGYIWSVLVATTRLTAPGVQKLNTMNFKKIIYFGKGLTENRIIGLQDFPIKFMILIF